MEQNSPNQYLQPPEPLYENVVQQHHPSQKHHNMLTTSSQSRWALEIVLWTTVVLRQPTQTTPSLMEGKRSTVSSASSWVVKTKFLHKHFYLTSFCKTNFIILSYRILKNIYI